MKEKLKKEVNVKEEKQALGIVWLVGILVILLGAVTVYSLNLREQLKEQEKSNTQNSIVVAENKNNNNQVVTDKIEKDNNANKLLSKEDALTIGNAYYEKLIDRYYKLYEGNTYDYAIGEIKKITTEDVLKQIKAIKEDDSAELASILNTTDVGDVKLEVKKITDTKIVFDVKMYGFDDTKMKANEKEEYIFENAFQIERKGSDWVISSISGKRIEK